MSGTLSVPSLPTSLPGMIVLFYDQEKTDPPCVCRVLPCLLCLDLSVCCVRDACRLRARVFSRATYKPPFCFLHPYKISASTHFIRYKVRGGTFDPPTQGDTRQHKSLTSSVCCQNIAVMSKSLQRDNRQWPAKCCSHVIVLPTRSEST